MKFAERKRCVWFVIHTHTHTRCLAHETVHGFVRPSAPRRLVPRHGGLGWFAGFSCPRRHDHVYVGLHRRHDCPRRHRAPERRRDCHGQRHGQRHAAVQSVRHHPHDQQCDLGHRHALADEHRHPRSDRHDHRSRHRRVGHDHDGVRWSAADSNWNRQPLRRLQRHRHAQCDWRSCHELCWHSWRKRRWCRHRHGVERYVGH